MKGFLLRWLINSISLFAVVHIAPGITLNRGMTAVIAALVIGLFNAFLRPLILILTLPVNLLTLGLFTLLVNGSLLYMASFLVKGFEIESLGHAILGALVFSFISFLLSLLVDMD
jgi:putative membrane protein